MRVKKRDFKKILPNKTVYMKKLYYKLVRLIGYTIVFEHTWGPDFNLKIKYSHITLYKYIGMYDVKYGGMKLKRVWQIKIR